MNKTYAGIGSRETPKPILKLMTLLAMNLEMLGYTLNSGAAPGADNYFEKGVINPEMKQIFLPWKGFEKSYSSLSLDKLKKDKVQEAIDYVMKLHPNPNSLMYSKGKFLGTNSGSFKLMTRNAFQVLGKTLDIPVDFVLCWTKDSKLIGGTSHAMRIAMQHGIPIFNLESKVGFESFYDLHIKPFIGTVEGLIPIDCEKFYHVIEAK